MQTQDRSESGISGDFEHLGGDDESVSYSMPASKFKGANQQDGEYSNNNSNKNWKSYKFGTANPDSRGRRQGQPTPGAANRSHSGSSF